jgi:dienelactone hydrolase
MRGYVSQPEPPGKVPGVLVIMEAFGVNQHIQGVTDKLSMAGCAAVAPVLYHRLGSDPLFSYAGKMPRRAGKRRRGIMLVRVRPWRSGYPVGERADRVLHVSLAAA